MKNFSILLLIGVITILIAIEIANRLTDLDTVRNNKIDRCVVLVLGYPSNEDGSLNPFQEQRVRTGVTAYRQHECQNLLFSGGAVSNSYIEAEAMAGFARRLGVSGREIIVENRARNTWENIGCSLLILKNFSSIVIVSEILHAKRAQRYLCRQKPFLCGHVEIIGHHLPWSLGWWKVTAAAHELGAWFRDLFLYEGNATDNAPDCPTGTSN